MNGLIGQTLGGYRITAQIGKGGMATVFKAFQPSLDRYVAIKVMPPYYAEQDDSFLKRFEREAKAIAGLRHPNILIVMDYGEQDGTTYIVMEYVESGTLTDLMGQPMPHGTMATLIEQVAGALDYAHESGVVHRDIKPSNILLPKPEWPLLTDFGLAKIVGGSQLTQSGTIAGTPAYMSPEQGRGDPVDSRSDIYSLGVVLYEMATGAVPFEAETPMAVVVKHIIDPLPLPRSRNPDLPEGIERVILKALAKEPDGRYQRAGELAAALTAAVADARGTEAVEAEAEAVPPDLAETLREPIAAEAAPVADAAAEVRTRAEADAAADPAAAQARPEAFAGGPAASGQRWRPGRRTLIGGLVAVAALGAFGAWRLLGANPGEQPSEQPAGLEQAGDDFIADEGSRVLDGRTIDQMLADAQAAIEVGEFEVGVRDLEAAASRQPRDPDQLVQIAQLYQAIGELPTAVEWIEMARSTDPEDPWPHEAAGYIYQEIGEHRAAIDAFENTIELDPQALWVYLSLAESWMILGEPDSAFAVAQRAREAGADEDPDLMESMGWLFLDHGHIGPAETVFTLMAERFPDDLRGAYGLAEVRYQEGDVAGAIAMLEPAVERAPEPAAYESLGWWHWELGQLAEAQRSFERAIELDPEQAYASYGGLANLLADQGNPDQAEALLRQATADFPENAQMHAELGHLLVQLERPGEAIGPYERALELDPENGYRYVELANALGTAGDRPGALEMLDQAAARALGDPWLFEAIGWGYADLASCDRAVDYFTQALELEPGMESAEEGLRACGG